MLKKLLFIITQVSETMVYMYIRRGELSKKLFVCLMVLNATFNNISVISWLSVLLVEEIGENHRPVASH